MGIHKPAIINPFSNKYSFEEKLFFWLRLSILGCFAGHGFWGISQKAGWLPFLTNFGFTPETAYPVMSAIGFFDILFGFVGFLYPHRAVLIWMAFWAMWTALLRPLSGMSVWEVLERGGNFGPPIAFLVLYATQNLRWNSWKQWLFSRLPVPAKMDVSQVLLQEWIFRVFIALLLIGHGCFGMVEAKEVLIEHFASVGIYLQEIQLRMVGMAEVFLGVYVFFRPSSTILWVVFVWKFFTELLYVSHGRWIEIFETIERMGDYTGPMALLLITKYRAGMQFDLEALKFQKYIRFFLAAYLVPICLIIAVFTADIFGFIQLPYEFKMARREKSAIVRTAASAESAEMTTMLIPQDLESGSALINRLKSGGNIVLVRHFQTAGTRSDLGFNGKFSDNGIEVFKDCSWQRVLNDKGQANALAVAQSTKKMGITWQRIYSSPFCRAVESAKLMSGLEPEIQKNLAKDIGDFTINEAKAKMIKFLKSLSVKSGENIMIMAHSTQSDAFGLGLAEGESAVISVNEKGFVVKGIVRDYEWPLATANPEQLGYQRTPPRLPASHAN